MKGKGRSGVKERGRREEGERKKERGKKGGFEGGSKGGEREEVKK